MKPLIAITTGDPMGIGPEIVVKALQDKRVTDACTPVVIGDKKALIKNGLQEGAFSVVDTAAILTKPLPETPGPTVYGGLTSFNAVTMASRITSKGEVKAMVTAPISKESWNMAGVKYTGHTDFLKEFSRIDHVLMMFTTNKLTVGLVSEHAAIKDLSKEITSKKIIHAAQLLNNFLISNSVKKPRIGVSAVNPHAGDGGKLGMEEKEIIAPALSVLKKENFNILGPMPVDALWTKYTKGAYDGILCMYHDQALLGLKLCAQEPIVHLTYGLPFIRTSPTHGTAFDIAGKNEADPSSMISAILYAVSHIK
ncbi:4-Hydroxythreonine-4-phosphate dehydrogenase [Elusimicrobium minutum Pei191]|uniref:4-Hydroxythreonine-4-phosphate dehydrogenase n=1 Tax=Elusimicrobium minutum (strain Pei191) TaxID=445932 RepID=B2KET4_ELUMP|nr:4-hydroxythreonine-4-phosphate dehydrogenase PdxA [Elusimicrobium minutum]ACC99030.1 4-Hydroxythreonine-4-phosphate dehydrogenase [Elusimicrobium minutum Pei191]